MDFRAEAREDSEKDTTPVRSSKEAISDVLEAREWLRGASVADSLSFKMCQSAAVVILMNGRCIPVACGLDLALKSAR